MSLALGGMEDISDLKKNYFARMEEATDRPEQTEEQERGRN